MLKYKIKTTHDRHPIATVEFEDEKYNLAGELLLAERSTLAQLLEALDGVLKTGGAADSFSGNAFTVYITKETTKITNDINGEEAEIATADLRKLTKTYKRQNDRIQH